MRYDYSIFIMLSIITNIFFFSRMWLNNVANATLLKIIKKWSQSSDNKTTEFSKAEDLVFSHDFPNPCSYC